MKIKAKPAFPKLKPELAKSVPKLQASVESQEFRNAMEVYLRECGAGRFSLARKQLLYERPWFLVIGPEGSGKTTLLSHCGNEFPLVYPSKEDGYIPGESVQPSMVWWCDRRAVWLDTPGRLLADDQRGVLKEIADSLAKARPKSPINGLVVVLDCEVLIRSDIEEVRASATSLRGIFDFFIKTWGIELPVFIVFAKTDAITGFAELFSDPAGHWNDRMLGATIKGTDVDQFPRIAFLEQFEPLVESLGDIRLRMLTREKDEGRRYRICQFPIDMMALREKIAISVTILFKQSAFTGKPRFCGFYFTGCISQKAPQVLKEGSELDLDDVMRNHPLNPYRKNQNAKKSSPTRQQAFFAKPLFSTVLPGCSDPVLSTDSKYHNDLFSLIARCGAAVVAVVLCLAIVASSVYSIRQLEKGARDRLIAPITRNSDGIESIERRCESYKKFSSYASGKRTLAMRITLYDAHRAYKAVKSGFVRSVRDALIAPCLALLEREMEEAVHSNTTGYIQLKNMLRAYLAISDQALKWPIVLENDTLVADFLSGQIASSIVPDASASAKTGASLKKVLRTWCSISREDSCRAIPDRRRADIELIAQVRRKLLDLVNPSVRYGIIMDNCKALGKELFVKNIIPDNPSAQLIKTRNPLSDVYTPQRWSDTVLPEIRLASMGTVEKEKWAVADIPNEAPGDSPKLTAEMTKLYLNDVAAAWLDFFSSTSIDGFSSMESADFTIGAFCAKKSPVQNLLSQFAQWSQQFALPDSTALTLETFKKFKQRTSFIQEFLDAYYADYNARLAAIARGLDTVQADRGIAKVFSAGADDPLVAAYSYYKQALEPFLETRENSCLKPLVYGPLEKTLAFLVEPLKKEINTVWEKRVYEPIANGFAKKYPFIKSDQEAERMVVVSYFRPQVGPFWNVVNTYCANRIVDRQGVWTPAPQKPGSIPLHFDAKAFASLAKAWDITNVFFDQAGALRSWIVTLTPLNSSLVSPKIKLNEKDTLLVPGKKIAIPWPSKDGELSGRIEAIEPNGGTPGRCSFSGTWSLMKLLNGAIAGKEIGTEFPIQCDLHIGGKSIYLPARVSVSDVNHPFYENMFSQFSVPRVLVK
jgi:type VI protein secretion system component VasK